jgi:hypothetical protein
MIDRTRTKEEKDAHQISKNMASHTVAGVTLVDTPLITKALNFAKAHYDDMSYNHTYRSWVFGALIASKAPPFKEVDLELHAVSAILHDLAWDCNSAFASPDKRFEVDCANAARDFLRREAPEWDARKLQLVWDAIALHTTASFALHKEPEVVLTHIGIGADFFGPALPGGLVTKEEHLTVVEALPLHDFKEGVRKLMCKLCEQKPGATYDSFPREFGLRYVEGYKPPSEMDIVMAPIKLD